MSDLVASIFKFENEKGFFVPEFSIDYFESDTKNRWIINCGGSRAYFIRIGQQLCGNIKDQCDDSHFMAKRVVTALLVSGIGLFRIVCVGRLLFEDISAEQLRFHSHLDLWNSAQSVESQDIETLSDWVTFLCKNTLFRRAAEDAYSALSNPTESAFFIYRGMEWLIKAGKIGWRELADDIGVSFHDIKEFKKMANHDLGQRHGIESGHKLRADPFGFGSLAADFLYGLCNVRKRIDSSYKGISSNEAARRVMKALPIVPYP